MTFVGKMRGAWARRLTIAAMVAAVLPALLTIEPVGRKTAAQYRADGLLCELVRLGHRGGVGFDAYADTAPIVRPYHFGGRRGGIECRLELI